MILRLCKWVLWLRLMFYEFLVRVAFKTKIFSPSFFDQGQLFKTKIENFQKIGHPFLLFWSRGVFLRSTVFFGGARFLVAGYIFKIKIKITLFHMLIAAPTYFLSAHFLLIKTRHFLLFRRELLYLFRYAHYHFLKNQPQENHTHLIKI